MRKGEEKKEKCGKKGAKEGNRKKRGELSLHIT